MYGGSELQWNQFLFAEERSGTEGIQSFKTCSMEMYISPGLCNKVQETGDIP